MNKKLLLFVSTLLVVTSLMNACKKDKEDSNNKSLTEEFDDIAALPRRGWTLTNNSSPAGLAMWQKGQNGVDKYGYNYGFPAYSFKKENNEYAYAGFAGGGPGYVISSWLISPILDVKNGDKISFYSRAANGTFAADRLQVRMNETDQATDVGTTPVSVGKFTIVLKDINETLAVSGYPQAWTRYEVTLSGLAAPKQTRFAFRYCPDGSKSNGVGIDFFQFTSL